MSEASKMRAWMDDLGRKYDKVIKFGRFNGEWQAFVEFRKEFELPRGKGWVQLEE